MPKDNVVKQNSKGYGYNYASLSDIAIQGYEIPKMKTGTDSDKEYVYYFDKELNDWVRGAQIVIPEGKMGKAQLYGAALTYARRYTTLMALQLTSSDDEKVEELYRQETEIFDEPSIPELVNEFKKAYSKQDQVSILNGLHITNIEEMGSELLMKYINYAKEHNSRQ